MRFEIRTMHSDEAEACEQVMRALPEWFGIEESILEYRKDVEALETWVATASGGLAGFLTLRIHNRFAAEIQVLAVRPEQHGRGVGSALVAQAEQLLVAREVESLQVKTLGRRVRIRTTSAPATSTRRAGSGRSRRTTCGVT